MTIKYQITKRLNKLSDKRNTEGLIYCMYQNQHCNQVRLNGDWVSYRKLSNYQRNKLSSACCPECLIIEEKKYQTSLQLIKNRGIEGRFNSSKA